MWRAKGGDRKEDAEGDAVHNSERAPARHLCELGHRLELSLEAVHLIRDSRVTSDGEQLHCNLHTAPVGLHKRDRGNLRQHPKQDADMKLLEFHTLPQLPHPQGSGRAQWEKEELEEEERGSTGRTPHLIDLPEGPRPKAPPQPSLELFGEVYSQVYP